MPTSLQFGPDASPDDPFTAAMLTGLASGGYALGNAIDNSAGLLTLCDINIVLPTAMTPAANGSLVFYFLPSVDGTNYPNPPATGTVSSSGGYYAGNYPFNGAATTVMPVVGLALPKRWFKPLLFNSSSVAFPTISGTGVITFRRYTLQMA